MAKSTKKTKKNDDFQTDALLEERVMLRQIKSRLDTLEKEKKQYAILEVKAQNKLLEKSSKKWERMLVETKAQRYEIEIAILKWKHAMEALMSAFSPLQFVDRIIKA